MKRGLLFVLLLVLLTAPAFSANAQSYDWCYSWDLRVQNPFTIMGDDGFWFQGVGYRTNGDFDLDLHYNHDQVVPPLLVLLRFGGTHAGTTSLNITGNAFTIPLTRNVTMPAGSGAYDVQFVPPAGTINVGSNVLDITLSASAYTDLRLVGVFGNGPNPFPANSCYLPPEADVDSGGLIEALATANAQLEGFDGDLGAGSLPTENGAVIFGYGKWLLSTTAADELFGPFSPIITHLGVAVGILVGLGVVYGSVYGVVVVVRAVVFVVKNWQSILVLAIVIIIVGVIIAIGSAILSIAESTQNTATSIIDWLIEATGGS